MSEARVIQTAEPPPPLYNGSQATSSSRVNCIYDDLITDGNSLPVITTTANSSYGPRNPTGTRIGPSSSSLSSVYIYPATAFKTHQVILSRAVYVLLSMHMLRADVLVETSPPGPRDERIGVFISHIEMKSLKCRVLIITEKPIVLPAHTAYSFER